MAGLRLVPIAVAVVVSSSAGLALPQPTSGPLQLSLACATVPELSFRLTVQNVSSGPAAAVIGQILANDKEYLLAPATLTLTRPGEPSVTLTYIDTTISRIGGRLDPWLVMLPAGASYSVSVPARHFRSRPDLKSGDFVRPAKAQVQLATQRIAYTNHDMQGLKLIHVWVGTLTTTWLDVPIQCAQ